MPSDNSRVKPDRIPAIRTVKIGNRRTTIRIEPIIWDALNEIAVDQGRTVHDILFEIDQEPKFSSFTAAIKIYIIEYYRERLAKRR